MSVASVAASLAVSNPASATSAHRTASMHRMPSAASVQSGGVLQKAASVASIHRTVSAASIHRTASAASVQRIASAASTQRTGSTAAMRSVPAQDLVSAGRTSVTPHQELEMQGTMRSASVRDAPPTQSLPSRASTPADEPLERAASVRSAASLRSVNPSEQPLERATSIRSVRSLHSEPLERRQSVRSAASSAAALQVSEAAQREEPLERRQSVRSAASAAALQVADTVQREEPLERRQSVRSAASSAAQVPEAAQREQQLERRQSVRSASSALQVAEVTQHFPQEPDTQSRPTTVEFPSLRSAHSAWQRDEKDYNESQLPASREEGTLHRSVVSLDAPGKPDSVHSMPSAARSQVLVSSPLPPPPPALTSEINLYESMPAPARYTSLPRSTSVTPTSLEGPYKMPTEVPFQIPPTAYGMQKQYEEEVRAREDEADGAASGLGDMYEPTASTPTPHPSVASAAAIDQPEEQQPEEAAQVHEPHGGELEEEVEVVEEMLATTELREEEPEAAPVREIVGRKPWEPPAAEDLSKYVHIHSDAVVEKYRTDPTAALEIASASMVQDIAKDFIDEMNDLKIALFRMTTERDELLAEIALLRARLLERREDEEEVAPFPQAVDEHKGDVVPNEGTGVILNWVLFQKQLRAAQADAARLRKELAARDISEGRAERAEEALRRAELVMLEAQEAYNDLFSVRELDIRALSEENIRLRKSINERVPREEYQSMEIKLADKERHLHQQKEQFEALQSGLRDELSAARELVGKVEEDARKREERLKELLVQGGEEQNRLLRQLILSEKALLPELRNELLLQQDTIARLLKVNSILEQEKDSLKADVEAAETLAEATENEREAMEKQLDAATKQLDALKKELERAARSSEEADKVRKELAELKGVAQHLRDQLKERDTYILGHKNTVAEMRVEHAAELKNAVDRVTASLRAQSGELLGRHYSTQSARCYQTTRQVFPSTGPAHMHQASQRTASRGMLDAIHILHDTFAPPGHSLQPRNVSPLRERYSRLH